MKIRHDFVTNSSSSSFIISSKENDYGHKITLEYIKKVLDAFLKAHDKLTGDDYKHDSSDYEILDIKAMSEEELNKYMEEYISETFIDDCMAHCKHNYELYRICSDADIETNVEKCPYRENRDFCKSIRQKIRNSTFVINNFDSLPQSIHSPLEEFLEAEYYRFA